MLVTIAAMLFGLITSQSFFDNWDYTFQFAMRWGVSFALAFTPIVLVVVIFGHIVAVNRLKNLHQDLHQKELMLQQHQKRQKEIEKELEI